MSSFEILEPFQSCAGMITKSDIQVSQRLANYSCNMIPSYLNGSQELPMDNKEYPYHDPFLYPQSFFELSDNCGGKNFLESMVSSFTTKGEQQSRTFPNDDLLTTNPTDILEDSLCEKNQLKSDHRRLRRTSPKISIGGLEFFKDSDYHIGYAASEDRDKIEFSRAATPTDTLIDTNDSSNPLAQLENISFDHLAKDTQSDQGSSTPKHSFSDQNSYDTSSLMYGNDDLTMFSSLVNCNEVMMNHKSLQSFQQLSPEEKGEQTPPQSVALTESPPSVESPKQTEGDAKDAVSSNTKTEVIKPSPLSVLNLAEEGKKNKLTGLQRRALDSIFSITDRPSRGLVLHIAAELCLHHITVKNFFSNGRRRLRRAAARLSDPERTRRENQRRKEKRRLAALVATASTAGSDKASLKVSVGEGASDSHTQREPAVLSPERKALMEKLAVKVQRSVAQKGLQQAMMNSDANKSPGNLPTSHKAGSHLTNNLESIIYSQIHSNTISSPVEIAQSTYNPLQPVRETGFQLDGGDITSLFSYSEGDQFSSYHPSPDQDLLTGCVNQDQNNVPYSLNQDEPYSPTSWQTLLNT